MTEPMTIPNSASATLDWLLTDLVARVAGAREAILLAQDGLLLAASLGIDRDRAERLAAIVSGFSSLTRGARDQLGANEVRQTVVEMDGAFLFTLPAGDSAHFCLVAETSCDIGVVAYETNRLVRQVGPHLWALPRGWRSHPAESGLDEEM
ncbi:roadblock/LC7 domain-containing protein [Allosalinactinospora lopnorensis]|uniref:roadblock/LC7 domain-containing protein n=1 Tax=Allosalinactinospora lopnorensis TaxID=1352348 RepID=UPI000623D1C1|nr:roadblock/LC7 domain-containing protein [Allosalinactinospora lopnorensis]